MFGVRVHLTEADGVVQRLEHRIIAEAILATRRPDQCAVDPPLERLDMAVGPGEGEGADEMGAVAGVRPLGLHAVPYQLHRHAEILGGAGPACRKQAGIAAQCFDAQAAIVGKGGQAGEVGRLHRLQFRIGDEGGAGFFRFGQVERRGGNRLDPIGAEQGGDFAYLAGIVAGDHQSARLQLADRLFLSEIVTHCLPLPS